MTVQYIDYDRLEAIDPDEYWKQKPYPWANPRGILTDEAFDRLVSTLPDLSLFDGQFGIQRTGGQRPHDRYTLEYTSAAPVAEPWREFIAELCADRYRGHLARLMGVRKLELNFHWHYTPNGCSVSPHCDARRKLGSHIFYMNTWDDWHPSWGGETVVLDDNGRFSTRAAPAFEDFDLAIPAETMDNRSFLFTRTRRSWHGVREIQCPEGHVRKAFIVVVNKTDAVSRLRAKISGKHFERY